MYDEIIDGKDITISSPDDTLPLVGPIIVKNGSLTLVNVDLFADTAFYLDNGIVNMSRCNVYCKNLSVGDGKIGICYSNVYGNIGNVYVEISYSYIIGDIYKTRGEIRNSDIVTHKELPKNLVLNNVVLYDYNYHHTSNIIKLKPKQITYEPKLKYKSPVLTWTDQNGNPGYLRGESIDGLDTWYGIMETSLDNAKITPGIEGRPPDDCYVEGKYIYGIWVLGKSNGKLKWSTPIIKSCIGIGGLYESKLEGLDGINKRYWLAIAKHIKSPLGEANNIKLEDKEVVGEWILNSKMCNDVKEVGGIRYGVIPVESTPYKGRLPDYTVKVDDLLYGVWKVGNIVEWNDDTINVDPLTAKMIPHKTKGFASITYEHNGVTYGLWNARWVDGILEVEGSRKVKDISLADKLGARLVREVCGEYTIRK
jgi:hypothetical protein